METITSILPITVIAAIILFVVKEVLEAIRRRSADRRKLNGIKTMIADELWFNSSIALGFNFITEGIEKGLAKTPPTIFSVSFGPSGSALFMERRPGETGTYPLHEPSGDTISEHLLDIATLDRRFFDLTLVTYQGITRMRQLLSELIDLKVEEDQGLPYDTLYNFTSFWRSGGVTIKDNLSRLYQECTGKESRKMDYPHLP